MGYARGLTFDMCFLARQLPVAAELAQACADTRLVLDHCGVPDIAGGGGKNWIAVTRQFLDGWPGGETTKLAHANAAPSITSRCR
ncbi:MAG: amidohydrolase family protein [Alphaproteobacteria bacterium]